MLGNATKGWVLDMVGDQAEYEQRLKAVETKASKNTEDIASNKEDIETNSANIETNTEAISTINSDLSNLLLRKTYTFDTAYTSSKVGTSEKIGTITRESGYYPVAVIGYLNSYDVNFATFNVYTSYTTLDVYAYYNKIGYATSGVTIQVLWGKIS